MNTWNTRNILLACLLYMLCFQLHELFLFSSFPLDLFFLFFLNPVFYCSCYLSGRKISIKFIFHLGILATSISPYQEHIMPQFPRCVSSMQNAIMYSLPCNILYFHAQRCSHYPEWHKSSYGGDSNDTTPGNVLNDALFPNHLVEWKHSV